ncbi:2-C-methyl-D-erythritol 4-phosphate cytidylyltransferase [Microbulbifer harenosus]|uniref:2-C-methyl-D-erythritol 4-phosphate cytidylyltransferase n=1 Tax=Microbulbifer harenosus TaxID=2576840 RepID=A0ABY2UKE9_9GAMM|nr:2-C-methyl-D-erythritol 4-phosphate cytidylyltransferase [Microbulbifer harenosus]TLM78428.1 2-C-methyl-D-erythritol 4-phosphate cytidylyltransferase [Microbulbifer harenosus]
MTTAVNPVETSYWVIVPAAGAGKRMGADKPKQYLPLSGKPLIAHTLENILHWPGLKGIVVAIAADDTEFATLRCAQDARIQTVTGGAERADSVLAALDYLSEREAPETSILVHDAARPLVRVADIRKLLAAAPMALLAQPASDTVKLSQTRGGKTEVRETLPRDQIWLAQTPQKAPLGKLRETLLQGLAENSTAITDEASALERAGFHPELVAACRSNFKITHPADLLLAEALLQHRAVESSLENNL